MASVVTILLFIAFWLSVGILWGSFMAFGIRKGLVKDGLADLVCGGLAFVLVSTLFLWNIGFTQNILGVFICVPACKLFQDYLLRRLPR